MKYFIIILALICTFWLGKWYQHFTGPDIYFEKLHTGLRVEVFYRGGGATVQDFVQIKNILGMI